MALKKFKPTSAGRRGMSGYSFDEITTNKPYKPLTVRRKVNAGRNSAGRITVRHQGGGHARLLRIVDFYFTDKKDIPAKVTTIEYDPNRTAYIALVNYADGEKRYVLAHKDMKVGDTIITTDSTKPVAGNRMLISNIPTGLFVYNVELIVNEGAALARSAGAGVQIVSQEGEYTQIKLPSGEIRKVNKKCYATVGQVGNIDHSLMKIGKAGRSRWMGKRPTVRGKAMNPVDHPHGGGEGRSPIGMAYPKTPWGAPALGVKTRKRKKSTNRWIVQTRKGKLVL